MVLFLDLFSGTSSVFSARTRSTNQIPLVTRPRWLGELRFDVAVTFHADGRHQKTGMGSKATSSSRAVTKHVGWVLETVSFGLSWITEQILPS